MAKNPISLPIFPLFYILQGMTGTLLDTGLFLSYPFLAPSYTWDGKKILISLILGIALTMLIVFLKRKNQTHIELTRLKKIQSRYKKELDSISLSETGFSVKISQLIRRYLEEKTLVDRALRKTGSEIRTVESDDTLHHLTELLDRGSYGKVLDTQERHQVKKLAYSLFR